MILLVIAVVAGGVSQVDADDKELFMGLDIDTSVVRPNVMVLMDSSGSMNTIIMYPKYGVDGIADTEDDGYDPLVTYEGTVEGVDMEDGFNNDQPGWYGRWRTSPTTAERFTTGDLENYNDSGKNFWTGCYGNDGTPNNFRVGSNSVNFNVGDTLLFYDTAKPITCATATIAGKYQLDGQNWFELENIKGGPIAAGAGHFQKAPDGQDWEPIVVNIYGVIDDTNDRWAIVPGNYVCWLYLHATEAQRDAVSHFTTNLTFDVNVTAPPQFPTQYGVAEWDEHWLGACTTHAQNRVKYAWTRIQAAREVICRVAELSNADVNLGLHIFDGSNGGELMDSVTPSNDLASDLVAYKNMVVKIPAAGNTPLAEALADVWRYFKPGASSKDYWPVSSDASTGSDPIVYWCQQNYTIVMTDGESTSDRFSGDGRFAGSMFREKPVKRTEAYSSFADWSANDGWGDFDSNEASSGIPANYDPSGSYCPNHTCWYTSSGSDYLDDVAYFLRHQDIYPDALFGTDTIDGWPGDQNILTYTIGFGVDNDMLRETAINGDGAFYSASSYDDLIQAFQSIITGILLRNFSFSAITAPKKTATTTSDDETVSFVGYFMPSSAASIWDGHLLAYEVLDKWGYDADGVDDITFDEFIYDTEDECILANNGTAECQRMLQLDPAHKWDAADKIPADRNLYTRNGTTGEIIEFSLDNAATLMPLFGAADADEMSAILTTIRQSHLGDVFHSDVGYIGPPSKGKQYTPNIDSVVADSQTFVEFYEATKTRRKVLFVGTNDGILHMLNADDTTYVDEREAGKEVWGFIPDEVQASVRDIVVNHQHTYTVDGHLAAGDICFSKADGQNRTWSTILCMGLRSGGNAYYAMDITTYGNQPSVLWKFEDPTYSGWSWGKPQIGKILVQDPDSAEGKIDKWVVVVPGGFAFNEENSSDLRGKAVFMLDAGTGEVLWMYGYHPDGDNVTDDQYYLTDNALMNFPVASSCTLLDTDSNGYMDLICFGNLGGHFFATDISGKEVDLWETRNLYQTAITTSADTYITNIPADANPADNTVDITVKSVTGFESGYRIRGLTSKTQGYITLIDSKTFTVFVDNPETGGFIDGEDVVTRTYDPIYHEPAVAFDNCRQLWIAFGTGDRDRPRSDPSGGRFVALRANNSTGNTTTTLDQLVWDADNENLSGNTLNLDNNGWYFDFPLATEKIFDPAPLILPDSQRYPHIYFNTYEPPTTVSIKKIDNPCDAPTEGAMMLYDLKMLCGGTPSVEGSRVAGRIAGGGIYGAGNYLMMLGTQQVGSVGSYVMEDKSLGERGRVIFWKERER